MNAIWTRSSRNRPLVGALVTALLFLSLGQYLAAAPPRLNVLLIVSDDMNNHLGCYGHAAVKTPAIDRLADRGMRFDLAYCQAPLCNPSRVSFLSGLRPDRTGVYTLETPTRQSLGDAVMLPECFREHGYFTADVGKIFHTGVGHEDPRSWDVEYREFGKRPPADQVIRSGHPPGPIKHTIDWAVLKTADAETPDGFMARKGVSIVEEAVRAARPFFVAVGFRRPHPPYGAPKQYFDRYRRAAIPLPTPAPPGHFATLLPAAHNYAPPPRPLTEREQREVIAAYYACESFVDAQVNVLLDALDRMQLWDNTIVVFLGDQGYHLGEHGGLWHKNSLFEESLRVPLIIWVPGMKAAGKPCRRVVELVDLYPTLTALCHVPTPPGLDGTDLRPLLSDPTRPWQGVAYGTVARGDDIAARVHTIKYLGHTVRTQRWRYTEWDGGQQGVELYDHRVDPDEFHNLAGRPEYRAEVARLHQLLGKLPLNKSLLGR